MTLKYVVAMTYLHIILQNERCYTGLRVRRDLQSEIAMTYLHIILG